MDEIFKLIWKKATAEERAAIMAIINGEELVKRYLFKPPQVSEVEEYCKERGKSVDPLAWHSFYSSKGWMIGKNKMKDWKAAVRTWERSSEKDRNNDGKKYNATAEALEQISREFD